MIRKIKKYLEFFWLPIILGVISIILWFNPYKLVIPEVSSNVTNFHIGLISTLLGFGFTVATAEGFKKLVEHKRVKKTFGLLKLVSIPNLKGEAKSMIATLGQYKDICDIPTTKSFIRLVSGFGDNALAIDKTWLTLVYSQDFLDSIKNDTHFNRIANAIFEIQIYTTTLTKNAVNVQQFPEEISSENKDLVINRVREIRNEINNSTEKLLKYTEKLEEEIDIFLSNNGVKHEEFER